MGPYLQRWRLFQCLAILVALFCQPTTTRADQTPANPVEALREALVLRSGEERNEEAQKLRIETLSKRVAALKTLAELYSALTLEEWKDTTQSFQVAAIDREARSQVAKRLTGIVRGVVQKGDAVRRLALAHYLGEMGLKARSIGDDGHGFGRTLTPELMTLCQDKDGAVRAAAARALGKIFPEPEPAAAALRALLKKDEPAQRQAAAEGLVSMIQIVATLQKKGRTQSGVEANPADVLTAAQAVISAAGDGLHDKNAGVRRVCLVAIQQGATALKDLVPDPVADQQFPIGRPLSDYENRQFQQFVKRFAADRALFLPVVKALKTQEQALSKRVGDDDSGACRAACQAVEAVALARTRLLRLPGNLSKVGKDPKLVPPDEDLLKVGLEAVVPALTKKLADPDVDVQLACLYALEALETLATPAAVPLMRSLESKDSYVRWGAVRALGRMAPLPKDEALSAKVTLALSKRLTDDNGDVRVTAMLALQRYGAAATPAVKSLGEAVNRGPADERILAMRTIVAIGPQAKEAIPALTGALAASEAPVRSTAARALGQFGAAAAAATEALTKALNDPDADVRQAVAEALLLVTAKEK